MHWPPRKHTRRKDASASEVAVDLGALFDGVPTQAEGWPQHCASREKRPKNPRCETGIDHSGIAAIDLHLFFRDHRGVYWWRDAAGHITEQPP
jgi:hypothetical protein